MVLMKPEIIPFGLFHKGPMGTEICRIGIFKDIHRPGASGGSQIFVFFREIIVPIQGTAHVRDPAIERIGDEGGSVGGNSYGSVTFYTPPEEVPSFSFSQETIVDMTTATRESRSALFKKIFEKNFVSICDTIVIPIMCVHTNNAKHKNNNRL